MNAAGLPLPFLPGTHGELVLQPLRPCATHRVPASPGVFDSIAAGKRRHDIRRVPPEGYAVGDVLAVAEELADGTRTGRELRATISYVTSAGNPCALSPAGLAEDFAILSISLERPVTPPGVNVAPIGCVTR